MTPIIQAAGIMDAGEAEMLVDAGFTHLGFPLRLDYHAEDIDDQQAARIIRCLPRSVTAVLITYLTEAAATAELAERLGVGAIQLHGRMPAEVVDALRHRAPGLAIFKSLVVGDGPLAALIADVEAYSSRVDAFITDTFDPVTGARGATGRVHDWQVSRHLAEISPRPLILAGGLRPENVARAIADVRPAGVDVHTGIERADGRKDATLAADFVRQARAGFALVQPVSVGDGSIVIRG